MTRHSTTIYFKVKLSDLLQEWIESSLINNVKSIRQSNHTLPSDRFVIISFKENKIPVSLYVKQAGNEMTQEEALAEVGGGFNIWL